MVFSILGLERLRIDDPVGAISVHGVAGIWGVLAVLLSNDDATLGGQLAGIVAIGGFTFLASLAVWQVVKRLAGIRIAEADVYEGAGIVECGMHAYPEFVSSSVVGGAAPPSARRPVTSASTAPTAASATS